MAVEIAKNRGGLVIGRGGSGKSHLLKKYLREAFIKEKYKEEKIHVIAFTHVAAQNCEGDTILHELHAKIQSCDNVIIVDELSMVSLRMWSLLATMQFIGNVFVCLGDPDGQFLPIADQHRHEQLEGIDRSDFMHTLCRG